MREDVSFLQLKEDYLQVILKESLKRLLLSPGSIPKQWGILHFIGYIKLLSTWPDTICARAFLPQKDEFNWRKRQDKSVEALDTGKSIKDSDLLVFLLPSETDWLPALEMLDLSHITIQNIQREHKWPILLATGLSVTANPIPMSRFFDAFIIGETEPTLGPILDIIKSLGSRRRPKSEILTGLSRLPGLYVPAVHGIGAKANIMRQWASSESIGVLTDTVSAHTIMPNTYILAISRGCPFNCRFCMAGYLMLPYREQKAEDLENKIKQIPAGSSLVYSACSPSAYDELDVIYKIAENADIKARISSHMKESPELSDELPAILNSDTLILSPETGSESLRRIFGKTKPNDFYFKRVKAASSDVEKVQVNFQVGIPFEEEEDRTANVAFVKQVMSLSKLPVTVRVDQFIPRPWTAFQWSPMMNLRESREYITELKDQLAALGVMKIIGFDPREAHIQALLIRGDEKIGIALEKKLDGVGWNTAFDYAKIDMNEVFLSSDPEVKLTWQFLNMGFGYTRLAREYHMAVSLNDERNSDKEK